MKDSINHMMNLCEDSKRELDFFKDELPIFRKRLEEVVSRNTNKEIMVQVEHFENKFRILSNHIDEQLHDVSQVRKSLSATAVANANYINVKMIESDSSMEDKIQMTSGDFYQTRKEYYRFLSQVL